MAIHPPTLYSGYTGFTIPFAFALAALLGRYPGEKWIHLTRRWTMIAWAFQSAGILLGAHWAYAVLGWGGYWGWDPVENASLMPWLTGTAFPAFRDHAGKARHDARVERLAGLSHVHAEHSGHVAHAQRRGQFRACLRANPTSATGSWALSAADHRRLPRRLISRIAITCAATINSIPCSRANPASCSTT